MTRRIRRRFIRCTLASLLLGAVTTIAVAWGVVMFIDLPQRPEEACTVVAHGHGWTITVYGRGRPRQLVRTNCDSGFRPMPGGALQSVDLTIRQLTHEQLEPQTMEQLPAVPVMKTAVGRSLGIAWAASPEIREDGYGPSMWSHAAGWPALAVRGHWGSPPAAPPRQRGLWGTGLINTGDGERLLPFLPIFPGFVLNTLVYAAPWWGLFLLARQIGRWRRRRRGRCMECGYDLRGLPTSEATGPPTCPECGA